MKYTEQIGQAVVTYEGTPEEIMKLVRLQDAEKARVQAIHTNYPTVAVPYLPPNPCTQCGGFGPCFHIDLTPEVPGVIGPFYPGILYPCVY